MEWMLTSGGTGKSTQKSFRHFYEIDFDVFYFIVWVYYYLVNSPWKYKIVIWLVDIIFNKEQFILILVLSHSVGRTTWFGGFKFIRKKLV